MVELLSEEEQWERLKAWLRTNGPSILLLTALLLLAWFGWQWWKGHGEKKAIAADGVYQTMLSTFDAGRKDEAFALADTLRREYPKSPYADAADLVAASVHVEGNELDKAAERLKRVAEGARDELVRPVARLRLARVQLAQGLHDEALATLGTADMGVHEAARLEIRGDVLLAKGDREGALSSYQEARAKLPQRELEKGGVGELLDLKIADLSGPPLPGAAATPAPAPAASGETTQAAPTP
jgi:predicted negative regulator of RcsB-dependent stress response